MFCLIDTKMCNNGVKVYQIHPIDDPGNMLRMVVRHHKVYVIEPGGHFANNDFCHLVRIVRRYDREQHTYLQEFAVVIDKDPIEEIWETVKAKELQIDDVPKKKKIKAAPPKPDWKLRKRQMRERSVADSRLEEEQAVMERYAKQQDEALFVGW